MAKIRIELDKKGVSELLNSPEVLADLRSRAERIAAAAGPGMVVDTFKGHDRVHATVRTDTPEAMKAEAENRALTRAIIAGR